MYFEMTIAMMVAGLGDERFEVREACHKTLNAWNKALDLRYTLPEHHRDLEVRQRVKTLLEGYATLEEGLPPFSAFKTPNTDYGYGYFFNVTDPLLEEVALQMGVVNKNESGSLNYVSTPINNHEELAVVEYVRRLFFTKGMTREGVRAHLKEKINAAEKKEDSNE